MGNYIKTIIEYTHNEKNGIISFIILRATKSAIAIISPLVYARVITNLLESTLRQTIYSFFILCTCYVVNVLLGHLIKVIENRLTKKINYKMKKQITEKLFSIPPSRLSIEQGKMFSLVLSDSSVISSTLFVFISALFSVITLLGIGIVVFIVNRKLALILLCTYPINIVVNFHFSRLLKKRAVTLIEQNDNYISLLKDTIGRIHDVSILGARRKITDELSSRNQGVYKASLQQGADKNNYSTLISAVSLINHLLLTGAGIVLVYMGHIGFGDFVAFNTYSKNLSSSIDFIINLNTVLQPGMVSIDRLLLLEEQYDSSMRLESKKLCMDSTIESIRFEGVCFSSKTRSIISDVSMDVRAGEIVGVYGENASGKTTIANLILTNVIPTSGQILINERPNTDFTYKSIVSHVAYVGTSKSLFQISIRDNMLISYGGTYPDSFVVDEICELLNVRDDIDCLPEKIDTIVMDNTKLSSGQIQKIQLARALLSNSDVLILDEALSNLDIKTKNQIKEHLLQLKQEGKIVFIISHIPDDYSICDKSYMVKNGTIHMLS